MFKVLVTPLEQVGKYSDIFSILKEGQCQVVKSPYPHPVEEGDLLQLIQGMDVILVGNDELTAKVIEGADSLKVISKYGAGVNNIDVEAATRKGIVVTYAPNQHAVADLAFGMMLCLARRICKADALVKAGEGKELVGTGTDVWRKTLGVIGTGRIGQAVIKRARGFEMNVLAYDVQRNENSAEELGYEYVSLDYLLSTADFVTIHVPLTAATLGLIGQREIGLMKPTSYLINTARGGIVDEGALYVALKEKRLAGAGLDVYEQEPLPPDSAILELDNVVTTPHMGADTEECLRNMDLVAAENILLVLRGQPPLYSLNYFI